jgi:hypothetical protein
MFWKMITHWFNRKRQPSRTHTPRKGRGSNRFCLSLESLENRYTPSGISGHVFQDVTGNGLSADDTPRAGVRVELIRDLNQDGALDRGDGAPVAVTFSGLDGSYSFQNLTAKTYFVREVLPFHNVRTAPALSPYYTVNLSGSDVTGKDFDSFRVPEAGVLKHVYFLINGTTKVTDLRGNVHQGDTVQAFFTVRRGETAQVTLVSYTALGATFDPTTAGQQAISDVQSGTFGPGTHSLTVQVPNQFFQVDFVLGAAIDHFGPAGSKIFYTPQHRLISADNGGIAPVVSGSLSGVAFLDNNKNHAYDAGDSGISNVVITLTGVDDQNNPVSMTINTAQDGTFSFTGLAAGTYTLSATLPPINGFQNELPLAGNLGGSPNLGEIDSIVIPAGGTGVGYDFGEIPVANGGV